MPPSPLPYAPSGLSLRRCASLPQRLHLASRALHPRAHLTLPTHPLRPRVPDRPARALLVSGQARRSAARLHSQPHSPAQRRCASQWCGALRRRALPRCRPHYAATAPPRVAHRRPKSAAGGRCTAAPLHGRCTAAPARAAARRRQHMPHGRSCCAAAASGAQTDPAGAAGVSSRTHASPSALLSISSTCTPRRAASRATHAHASQPGALPTRRTTQAQRPPATRASPQPQGAGPARWPPACHNPNLTLLGGARAWGTAFSTPEDMPTSMRQTRPLHSQLAPPSCRTSARARASARAPPRSIGVCGRTPLACSSLHVHALESAATAQPLPNARHAQGAHWRGQRRARPPGASLEHTARASGATCGVCPTTSCRAPSISSVPCSALHTRRRSSCVVNFSRPNCARPRATRSGGGAGGRPPACRAGPDRRGRAARPQHRRCGLGYGAHAHAGLQRAQ